MKVFFISSDNMNKNIILGKLYRPPRNLNANYQSFMREITSILEKIKDSRKELILAGDLNIYLLKLNDKPIFNEIFDLFTS